MQLKPYKVHHDVLMASASEEQVTEDGAGQAAFNLINHVQQSKGGRGVDKGDKLNISSSLSIMDQRGGWRDEDREPASVYLIDHVRPVGGSQNGDVSELLDAVHLCQELSQDPVPHTTGTRGAEGMEKHRR